VEMIDNEEIQKKLALNLINKNIEYLVVIGGDGSYQGAKSLSVYGIKVICIPGTIDNDVQSTQRSIGFDTALNTIVQSIDKLRDTSTSHQRCSIVEVMGRNCGDLALYSGITCGAEAIITKDNFYDINQITKMIIESFELGKRHFLLVITENVINASDLVAQIINETHYDARLTVLGHIQRGGSPSAFDRYIASKFGYLAVQFIKSGIYNICIGTDGINFYHTDLNTKPKNFKVEDQLDYAMNRILK
jgi:6-phosphofructokinase 1